MKRRWVAIGLIASGMILGGCSPLPGFVSTPDGATAESATAPTPDSSIAATGIPGPTSSTSNPAPPASSEPPQPEAVPAPDETSMTEAEKPQATSDEAFLAIMQQSWPEGRPSDGDLVGAAQRVCEAAGAGAPVDEIVVIDDVHNNDVVIAATSVYCPQ